MQPNRLENVWSTVKPEILEHWDRLAEEDLEATEGQFDRIVEVIRKTYYRGRSHLSLEGEIRDWLLGRIRDAEDRKS